MHGRAVQDILLNSEEERHTEGTTVQSPSPSHSLFVERAVLSRKKCYSPSREYELLGRLSHSPGRTVKAGQEGPYVFEASTDDLVSK